MIKKYNILLTLFLLSILSIYCSKTYDEGSNYSFRTRQKRITKRWKLELIEIGFTKTPMSGNHFITLTNEKLADGYFKATFEKFPDEFCQSNPDTSGQKEFTTEGVWKFYEGVFGGRNIEERLSEKEGLLIKIIDINYNTREERWKIVKLTNSELHLFSTYCGNWACFYTMSRKLYFKAN